MEWGRRMLLVLVLLVVLATIGVVQQANSVPFVHTIPVQGAPVALGLDTRTGRAFIVTSTNTVLVLDARRGSLDHVVALDASVAPPAQGLVTVDVRTAHVFVASQMGLVSMLDAQTGRVLRTVMVGYQPIGMADDDQRGRVFVLTDVNSLTAGQVSVLDAHSGRIWHGSSVGQGPVALVVDSRHGYAFVANRDSRTLSVLDAGGHLLRTLVVGPPPGQQPSALAVDASTGGLWVAYNTPGQTGPGSVSLLTAQTTWRAAGSVGLAPVAVAIDERTRRAFVLNSGENTVSVLDTRSGALVRTVRVGPAPVAVAVDERSARVLVLSQGLHNSAGVFMGRGSVSILDAHNGSVVRTVTVGVDPTALVVDPRSGRAVVINDGGAVLVPNTWGWVPGWLQRWLPSLSGHPRSQMVSGTISVLDVRR